jgi:hypothetical protein
MYGKKTAGRMLKILDATTQYLDALATKLLKYSYVHTWFGKLLLKFRGFPQCYYECIVYNLRRVRGGTYSKSRQGQISSVGSLQTAEYDTPPNTRIYG